MKSMVVVKSFRNAFDNMKAIIEVILIMQLSLVYIKAYYGGIRANGIRVTTLKLRQSCQIKFLMFDLL